MSRRIRMTVAYDGTSYGGWQRQNNAVTIQQKIEEAVESLFSEKVTVDASGRTDAGVHALGQVAAMTLEYPIPVHRLVLALNARLPADIRILNAAEVDPAFHPQFQAKRKTYRYSWYNGAFLIPQYRLYMAHLHEPVDFQQMNEALKDLIGTHDFYALSASGRTSKTTVRTIYRAEVLRRTEDPDVLDLFVEGNGFLYNMVRIIAGTAADIGRGRLPASIFRTAIDTRDRTILGMTAPACGLTLMNVCYEED